MPLIPTPVLRGGCLPLCAWLRPTAFPPTPLFPAQCDFNGCLSRPVLVITSLGAFSLTLRWLGVAISGNPADCGGSLPYVIPSDASAQPRFVLDPIRAHADGAWTSSTVIEIFHVNLNGTAPAPRTVRALWGQCADQRVTFPSSGAGPRCSTNPVATLTLFDDATFTLTP